MRTLDPHRYRVVTGLGLLVATGLIGFGLERMARGALVVGATSTLAGLAAGVGVFLLDVEGRTERPTLLLLTREACPLCDEALAICRHVQQDLPFDLWEADIHQDPELAQRFSDEVPVLIHEGRKLASMEVREDDLRDALREHAGLA